MKWVCHYTPTPSLVAPVIQTPPTSVDLVAGGEVILSCLASGFPQPHSTWFKTDLGSDLREELGIVGPSHLQLSGGLRLHDVRREDGGTYECVVENVIGRITGQATVRVEGEGKG